MIDIYVVEHPRSGATWLQRLLSDALSAFLVTDTSGATMNGDYWGDGQPRDEFRIIKSHSRERQGRTIFVYRDPRDVMVSAWHYMGEPRGRTLYDNIARYLTEDATLPDEARYGKYESFIRVWYKTGLAEAMVRYEDLHYKPIPTVDKAIYQATGRRISAQAINNAYFKHEFTAELSRRPELTHSMWRGKIGAWREYFTQREADLVQSILGDLMLEQGYIDGPEWVHDVRMK